MRIRIDSVLQNGATYLIGFTCSIGTGRGTWRSSRRNPMPGASVDVEFDFGKLAATEMRLCRRAAASMSVNDTGVLSIHGHVDSVDEDGVWFLRLATDALVMVESDTTPIPGEDVEIELPFERLGVSAFG